VHLSSATSNTWPNGHVHNPSEQVYSQVWLQDPQLLASVAKLAQPPGHTSGVSEGQVLSTHSLSSGSKTCPLGQVVLSTHRLSLTSNICPSGHVIVLLTHRCSSKS